jgi:AcrR family transcriptional regulator
VRRAAPARTTYHHGDLRNALLEASVRLVATKGVEAFSLREAAREVGVSPNAAYRHFADRDALLGAVAADGFGRMAEEMERHLARAGGAPGTPAHAVARLVAVGDGYVEFAVRHPARFRVMFGPWLRAARSEPETGRAGRSAYALLGDALDALVAAGVIPREARAGAEIVAWSAVHGLAALLVDGSLGTEPRVRRAALDRVERAVLVGLGGDPALALPLEALGDWEPRSEPLGRSSGEPPAGGDTA